MKEYISQRLFNILLILEKELNWMTSSQLSILLKVSNKTIQKDIHTLNNVLPANWSIEISNGLGYKLISPSYETVQYRFGNIDEKIKFDALSYILNNEVANLSELSEKLYSNISSTHKLTKEIDLEIQKIYSLRVSDRSLHIKGEENSIRRLIFDMQFFKNNEHQYQILFQEDKEKINNFIIHHIRIIPSIQGLNVFYLFLNIVISRIKNGFHSEKIPKKTLNYILNTELFINFEPLFAYLEKIYSINLSINERITIYYAFINTEFHLIDSYSPTFFKNTTKNYPIFSNLINKLSNVFDLELTSSHSLMIKAFNIYYAEEQTVNIPQLMLYKDFRNFKNNLELNDVLVEKFINICNKWSKKTGFNLSQQSIMSLLFLIQDFKISNTKVDVLLIKSNSFTLNEYLLTKLKRELGDKVNFISYYPSNKNNLKFLIKAYDFVLSDISIPKSLISKPHVFLGETVNNQTLYKINDIIKDILKNKDKLVILDKTKNTIQK